ncbi:ead/Ea22-like family protein [Cronobacter sakazakii]|nr:ead/Ea22-like family protein [Cronobacter sakazakii]
MMNIAKLKAAAEKAHWGDWSAYKPHSGARGYEVRVGSEAVAQHCLKDDAAFIAEASPKTVLCLIAALEAAEKQRDSWRTLAKQNIAEREKDIAALDEARQRIADLESKLAQSESWAVSAQSHIASLESRTVRLPVADIGTAKEFYEDAVVVPLSVVNEACVAAGINLETGGEA